MSQQCHIVLAPKSIMSYPYETPILIDGAPFGRVQYVDDDLGRFEIYDTALGLVSTGTRVAALGLTNPETYRIDMMNPSKPAFVNRSALLSHTYEATLFDGETLSVHSWQKGSTHIGPHESFVFHYIKRGFWKSAHLHMTLPENYSDYNTRLLIMAFMYIVYSDRFWAGST